MMALEKSIGVSSKSLHVITPQRTSKQALCVFIFMFFNFRIGYMIKLPTVKKCVILAWQITSQLQSDSSMSKTAEMLR